VIKSGILWVALFCCALANAQTFDFNANCRNAYNAIIALRLNEGKALIAAEEKKNPTNLIPIYLENYVDFLNLYTTDARDLYNQLKSNKDLRIEMLSVGDRDSPYFLFCAAEMNLQWASVNIKFGDYLSAVFSIKKAYKFLVENEQRFPDFKPNKKTLGVLYALIGSVPDKYKWGVNMLGMEGNLSKGLNELKTLVEYGKHNDYIYQDETVIYYAFLLFHLQDDPDSAWRVLMDNGFPKKNNLMNLYACAHIGIYGKHNDEALKLLEARPNDSSLAPFPFLTYLYALGKLNKLEPDADSYFKKFIAEYKGENHLKSAYQKIAWGYLVKGDSINYKHFIGKVNKTGSTTVDADKQAQREAETNNMPNINLLKARLLFDGGYYEKAAIQMKQLSEKSFTLTDDQTEYLYRLGRIYHAWNKPDTALMYYAKAIEKGKSLPRYFAANSAFESGELYEAKGDKEKAKYYYEMCLSFQDHEYKNGLDQKAKAGLNRIQ
jgi:predicted negative regulator of RcsB-dependent stress response